MLLLPPSAPIFKLVNYKDFPVNPARLIMPCLRWLPFGLLLALSLPLLADHPDEGFPPPANPREFHEQEWQRIVRGLTTAPEESPLASTQADYDALYYHLTIDVRAYSTHMIYGAVEIHARSLAESLDSLVLDLCSDLTVDSVIVGELIRPFLHNGHQLIVALDRIYGVSEVAVGTVYYHGTPCATNLFNSFDYYNRSVGSNAIPSIATLSEPYGARDWWPSKNLPQDKADSVRISIIVADTLTATSNGILESVVELAPDSRVFTWFEKHPIATYLVSLNATNYATFSDWYTALNGDSMPIVHYTYPERLNYAQTSWNVLPAMMDFCADTYGEFPFVDEKYGHTMFRVLGGMEHQCNTSYGRGITNGQHNYDYIVIHELAHQYFGDAVTLETWPDIWLNEGFASYSEALWIEHLSDFEAYRSYMLTPGDLGVVDPSGPIYDPASLFNNNTVYHKGAWILHILRGVLRDDSLFFAIVRGYYQRHLYETANTQEFLACASDLAGFDITPYLWTYLYRTNRPHFTVSFGTGVLDGLPRTAARICQTQTDPDTTFQTRLDLEFSDPEDTTVSVINSQWNERYYFDLGWTPDELQVDPLDWVLKSVQSEELPVTVLNTALTAGFESLPYRDTLVAIGGDPPYAWSLLSGTLPPGIVLAANGVISGSSSAVGFFPFSLRVRDMSGISDSVAFTLEIGSSLVAPRELTVYRTALTDITLRWSPVAAADSYYVYRALLPDLSDATRIAVTALAKAQDQLPPSDPDVFIRRFYFVTAVNYP